MNEPIVVDEIFSQQFNTLQLTLSCGSRTPPSSSPVGGSDEIASLEDLNEWSLTPDKKKRKYSDSIGTEARGYRTLDGGKSSDSDDDASHEEYIKEGGIQDYFGNSGPDCGETVRQYSYDEENDSYGDEKDCCNDEPDCCKKPVECCIGQSTCDQKRACCGETIEPLMVAENDNSANLNEPSSFHWTKRDAEFEIGCHRDEFTLMHYIGHVICTAIRFTETSATRFTETRVIDSFIFAINFLEDQVELELIDPTRLVDTDLMNRVQRFVGALDAKMIKRGAGFFETLAQAMQSAWDSSEPAADRLPAVITVKAVLGDREWFELQLEFQNVDNHPHLPSDAYVDLREGIYDPEIRIGIRVPMNPNDTVILYAYEGWSLEHGPIRNLLSQITELRGLVSGLALNAPYQSEIGRYVSQSVNRLWSQTRDSTQSQF